MTPANALPPRIHANYRNGNLKAAEAECLEILKLNPFNADAHHILGLVSMHKGNNTTALQQIIKAIEISPKTASYYISLGNLYLKNGDMDNALVSLQQAIKLDPNLAEAHYSSGVILQHAGNREAATEAYKLALKINPDYPEASCNLGALFHATGKLNDAIACYIRSLSVDPSNYRVENNLAHAYLAQQQHTLAEKHFRKVLLANPELHEAHFSLGITLNAQGKQSEALKCFRQTVHLKPDHTGAHNNIGTILIAKGDYEQAANAFRKASLFAPDNAKIHFNLGASLKESGHYTQAINSFHHALRLDEGFSKAYAELCRCNQIICKWDSDIYTTDKLVDLTKACLRNRTGSPVYPFDSLSLPFTPETLRDIASSHAGTICRNTSSNLRFMRTDHQTKGRRLRIGYVSQKFNNHAGAHLIASLFGLHNRENFEIFAYSIGHNDRSVYRQRIMQGCEHFIDIHHCNFTEAAQRISDDGINILVDLGVYNSFSRTEIFALRPAPIQVSYLGFPGTSGADFYDYILTDRTVTPPDQQQWYSESFVYLPTCYQVNDHLLRVPDQIPERSQCSLPDNVFVFCCFNNSYKIEPIIFEVWMRILSRVPDAVLWLLHHSPETTGNIRREAESNGISGARLIFAEKLPKDLHLARHKLAGLFLDTLIYNAHTTASDSLRVGVPVVTTPGLTFASRVASSLLKAVDLPEMITANLDEYEELAVKLATDNVLLSELREKLVTNVKFSPLFDTPLFARHLETAYEMMWERHSGGKPSDTITIPR